MTQTDRFTFQINSLRGQFYGYSVITAVSLSRVKALTDDTVQPTGKTNTSFGDCFGIDQRGTGKTNTSFGDCFGIGQRGTGKTNTSFGDCFGIGQRGKTNTSPGDCFGIGQRGLSDLYQRNPQSSCLFCLWFNHTGEDR